MIDYLLLSAELSLVTLLVMVCLRSAPARWRLCTALVALPVAVLPWSLLPPVEIAGAETAPLFLEALPVLTPNDAVEMAAATLGASSPLEIPWPVVLAAGTVPGLVAFFVLAARQRAMIRRWAVVARDGRHLLAELPEHGDPNCGVRVVPNSDLAAATGFLRPTVWLGDHHLANGCLRAVLLHELVHVRRQHTRITTLVALIRCLLWWHPFTWVWSSIVRREVEYDCDEACARLVGRGTYRNALASLIRTARPQSVAVGLTGRTSFNIQRLLMLERIPSLRASHRAVAAAGACAVVALVVDVAVVAETAYEGVEEQGTGHDRPGAVRGKDGWWQLVGTGNQDHIIRLGPNTTIYSAPTTAKVSERAMELVLAGQERPTGDGIVRQRLLVPGSSDRTIDRADPSLEFYCSAALGMAEATVGFRSPWVEVEAPADEQQRAGVFEIRTHTGSSEFFRKPLHDGSTATVAYRFDSETPHLAEVPLEYRVDLSTPGDWESRFKLDAEAVARIRAMTARPERLTLSVSNSANGYRTGEMSFDLASRRLELKEFLHRCDALIKHAAA